MPAGEKIEKLLKKYATKKALKINEKTLNNNIKNIELKKNKQLLNTILGPKNKRKYVKLNINLFNLINDLRNQRNIKQKKNISLNKILKN